MLNFRAHGVMSYSISTTSQQTLLVEEDHEVSLQFKFKWILSQYFC